MAGKTPRTTLLSNMERYDQLVGDMDGLMEEIILEEVNQEGGTVESPTTVPPETSEATKQKEAGNVHFKTGRYNEALSCYTRALELNPNGGPETGIYFKNRAAVHLKQNKFDSAVSDTDKALELVPNDPKALFRRCQAYEGLQKIEAAYKDACTLIRLDPKNSAIQPILQRLSLIIHERALGLPTTPVPNEVKKCAEFITTVLKIASPLPSAMSTKIKNLIQDLLDDTLPPEDFIAELQTADQSLQLDDIVPFLKKNLPQLRHLMDMSKLKIDGVQRTKHQVLQTAASCLVTKDKEADRAVRSGGTRMSEASAIHEEQVYGQFCSEMEDVIQEVADEVENKETTVSAPTAQPEITEELVKATLVRISADKAMPESFRKESKACIEKDAIYSFVRAW